ncbi:MAG: hypothetical protein C4K47_07315 [Candidatus Thorarchaeota archaeon]|nr:MAG: hypothetical protein C4K47_07315 [Candidatus Thorarchaeota archaeon]
MIHLAGKNMISVFQKSAGSIVSQVSVLDGIAGIVLLGGLTRGFADKHSDLDIMVFLTEANGGLRSAIRRIANDEQKKTGTEVDLEIHPLEGFERRRWTEVDRWDFCSAKVVFDATGKVDKMIHAKLAVPEEFWVKRVVVCSEHLKWYCCPPSDDVSTIVETSIERGDLTAAHYCLNYGLELLIRILFALNKAFLPPPKWRIIYSKELRWHPANYETALEEILRIRSLSKTEIERRLKLIRELWSETAARIMSDMALSPQMISKYYVEKVLHQGNVR